MVSSQFWKDSGEIPGIVNWGLQGRFRLIKNRHFTQSSEMILESKEFKSQMNPTREFLIENCEFRNDVLALQQMGGWKNQQMALHYGQISSSRAKDATLKAERKADHLKLIKSENVS